MENFINNYFSLLGSCCDFIEILESIIKNIGWCNNFMGFDFPDDYDNYTDKKENWKYKDFSIENSVTIYIDTEYINWNIDEMILSRDVFIEQIINNSFRIFSTYNPKSTPQPSIEELKKGYKLIEIIKNLNN